MGIEILPLSLDISGFSFSGVDFYSKYRRHPGFSSDDLIKISCFDFRGLFNGHNYGFMACRDEIIFGFCVIVRNEWESEFFGLEMGRVFCCCSPDLEDYLLSDLIKKSVDSAFSMGGIRHFSIDVDIDDYKVVNCLYKNGFEVLDLKRTYFTNRLHDDSGFLKSIGRVRNYMPSDFLVASEIIDAAVFETRFTRDKFIDRGLANALYKKWFLNLIADADVGSQVVVFERMGVVVGCGGIGQVDFSKYGINRKMRSGSLYACSAAGVGGYAPVLYRLTKDAIASHGLVETTVSLNNAPAVRVVEGIRPNRSITTYALRRFIE